MNYRALQALSALVKVDAASPANGKGGTRSRRGQWRGPGLRILAKSQAEKSANLFSRACQVTRRRDIFKLCLVLFINTDRRKAGHTSQLLCEFVHREFEQGEKSWGPLPSPPAFPPLPRTLAATYIGNSELIKGALAMQMDIQANGPELGNTHALEL